MNALHPFIQKIDSVFSRVFSLDTLVYSGSNGAGARDVYFSKCDIMYSIVIEYDITYAFSLVVGFSPYTIPYLKKVMLPSMQKIHDYFDEESIYSSIMGILVYSMERSLENPVKNFKYDLPKRMQYNNDTSLFKGFEKAIVGNNNKKPIICVGGSVT